MIGKTISHYQILEKLGAGGMGEVYRARDKRLERDVAIKVLPPHLADDPTALARFERETKAVAALSHPNILEIFDVGSEGGIAYAVTELLEGETLRGWLAGGALPVRKTIEYAVQVAEGLAAAHEKGFVHRDLKPENLLVCKDGRVKILDFGLSKKERSFAGSADPDAATQSLATEPGLVLGTVSYMAPEQIRGQSVDHRADLFAFGLVLYEMLAGRRAFQGLSSVETMNSILKEEPPDLAAVDPKIPAVLVRLVQHCLEKNPGGRFQSARDLAFALRVTPTMSPSSGVRALAIPRSRHRLLFVAAGLAILLVLGIAASWFFLGFTPIRSTIPPPSFIQTTFRPQAIFRAAFAPDGQTIVYSAALEGNVPELFESQSGYREPKRLGLPATHLLAISSRNEMAVLTKARYLGLFRLFSGTLARVMLGSTAAREILENVREADWSPDGSELAIVRNVEGKDRLEYPIGNVLYESAGCLSDVRVSPRGDRVAFYEHPQKMDNSGIVVVVDCTTRNPKTLTGRFAWAQGLAWSPEGDEIIFTASSIGWTDMMVRGVDFDGRQRVALSSAGGLVLNDVSRTGRWLVSRDDVREGIRALAPHAGQEQELTWMDHSTQPSISRDGGAVLFSEFGRAFGFDGMVCYRKTDGSAPVPLGEGWSMDLSPDGRYAAAVLLSKQQFIIYPIGPGEKRVLPRGNLEKYHSWSWFPDQRSILICGNEPGKASRCYMQDLASGVLHPVSREGERGLVSPDGQSIVVWMPEKPPLIYRFGVDNPSSIPILSEEDVPIRWSLDGRSIFVHRRRDIPGRIEQVDTISGKRDLVHMFGPPERAGLLSFMWVDVAANPRVFVYQYLRTLSQLYVVEGTS